MVSGFAVREVTVYDGTGAPGRVADVLVHGDRIAEVAEVGHIAAGRSEEVDGRGFALAPGFIDVHSHDDIAVLADPAMDFKIAQGVTTDIVGNCGFGASPYDAALRMLGSLTAGDVSHLARWEGHRGYLATVDEVGPALNVAVLAGHGTLRLAVMGNAERAPTAAELDRMCALVAEAVDAGAVGLSTGLIYEPGRFALTDELVALASVMAGSGALYASHIRNEAEGLLDAVAEAIAIGEQAGVPVQISHHKAAGLPNWGRVRESLELIDDARKRGIDVTADQYPYTAGSTSFAATVGNSRRAGGGLGRVDPERVRFASTPHHPEWEGRTLAQVAVALGLDSEAAADHVLAEEGPGAIAILDLMDEADVRTVMAHPTTMIGSDGLPATGARPHPRLYGTFPRVLGRYARDEGVLDLAAAVHRMTGLPAAKFGLTGRGEVRQGAFADLVLFDPDRIVDTATYDDPRRYPDGIAAVWVNGVAAVRDGRPTDYRAGRALRRT